MPATAEVMLAELHRGEVGTRNFLERVPEGRDDRRAREKSVPLRGQFIVHLRLPDRPVPPIYERSADEPSF